MINRICPYCNIERYSAYTGIWVCKVCGTLLTQQDAMTGSKIKSMQYYYNKILSIYNNNRQEKEV